MRAAFITAGLPLRPGPAPRAGRGAGPTSPWTRPTRRRPASFRVHPALLDAAFQALIAACGDAGSEPTLFMPVHIRQILFHAPVGAEALADGRLLRQTGEAIEGDIVLFGQDGTVLMEVKGLRCLAVGRRTGATRIPLDRWMHEYTWDQVEPAAGFADAARWLVFSDGGAVGAAPVAKVLRNQGAEAVIEVVAVRCLRAARRRQGPGPARLARRHGGPAERPGPRAAAPSSTSGPSTPSSTMRPSTDRPCGPGRCDDAGPGPGSRHGRRRDAPRPRLYVATRDAQHVDAAQPITGLNQSGLIGFLRVVAIEHPELRPTLIDLDLAMSPAAIGRRLGQEMLSGSAEDDVALRGPNRYVHRLMRRPERRAAEQLARVAELGRDPSYRLEIPAPGHLDKVRYAEVPRRPPGQDEIELRIRAVGLNFKDVLKVLGLLDRSALAGTHYGQTLGMEASAVVTAIGPGVTGYAVGDEIITLVAGCLASHVTIRTDQLLSLPRPAHISPAEGATVPIAFMTAYYALTEAARLRRGETVLIHAAAGGVGMAAIQVARWLGATIYATAGSPEKRAMLLGLGVAQVWDSRSLEFVDGLREATGGRGVNVVLNSLSGEAMERSFDALAPLGRFIEIGKRDILEKNRLPMAAFDRSVSFSSLDLDRLTLTCQHVIVRLFEETWQRFAAGDFEPLPLTRFPASRAGDALRFMAQAKQVGKVVIDFDDAADVEIVPLAVPRNAIRGDATYLVTGAFGGVGLELVRRLAAPRGAQPCAGRAQRRQQRGRARAPRRAAPGRPRGP